MQPGSSKSLRFVILTVGALLASASAYGNTNRSATQACAKTPIRSIVFANVVKQEINACFEINTHRFLSQSCNTSACQAVKRMTERLPIATSELSGEFGTSAAKLCAKLDGTFEVLEMKSRDGWVATDRCLFPDGSFVSGSKLLSENSSKTSATDSLFDQE